MKYSFGLKVDLLQAEHGINLTELAKKVHKSKQCVNRLKKSKRPRPETIHAIAKAFEVPVRFFFDNEA